MFEKWGKKFAYGVKQEAANPETIDKFLNGLLKVGVVLAIIFVGKSERNKSNTQTVIVNNYIYKEECK